MWAGYTGSTDMVDRLLESNRRFPCDQAALCAACPRLCLLPTDMFFCTLPGGTLQDRDRHGNTAVLLAARSGQLDTLKHLEKLGADIFVCLMGAIADC